MNEVFAGVVTRRFICPGVGERSCGIDSALEEGKSEGSKLMVRGDVDAVGEDGD